MIDFYNTAWLGLTCYIPVTLGNREDSDDNAAFHQGLHCLLRLKYLDTEIHLNLVKIYL